MTYEEMMQFAPKDCQPTVVDNRSDYEKAKEEIAKELGKKVEDLTEKEKDQALCKLGLCPLDF